MFDVLYRRNKLTDATQLEDQATDDFMDESGKIIRWVRVIDSSEPESSQCCSSNNSNS